MTVCRRPHQLFLAVVAISFAVAGCGGDTPAAQTTVTVTSSSAAEINTAFFAELNRLDDKFIARVSAVPEVRSAIMDRRKVGTTEMANLAHDLCMHSLAEPVDGGPEMALRVAGTYIELSMYIPGEPMSAFVKQVFVQSAADTFCPDNPAGVR